MQLMEKKGKERAGPSRWDARKVQDLRRRLGLSQQAMARELGVRQQTVSDWETGLHAPRGTSNRMLSMVAEQAARYTARTPRGGAGDPAAAGGGGGRSAPDGPE